VMAVLSGIGGAVSVVAANSWMNDPAGFTVAHGQLTSVDPVAVFFNGATYDEVPHMVLAAYMVAGGLAATPYAVGLLRGRRDRYHRLGFLLPFSVAAIATPFQIGVGDTAARAIASQQPVKFASMEYVPRTMQGAPEWLGGVWYHGHVVTGTGIPLPDVDSLLAGFSPHTKITGWDSVPPGLRPPMPTLIHPVVRSHGRHRIADAAVGSVAGVVVVAPPGPAGWPPRHGLPCGRRAVRDRLRGGDGKRLGRHRSRPAALDRVPDPAHQPGGHHRRRGTRYAGRDAGHLRRTDHGHVRHLAGHAAALAG